MSNLWQRSIFLTAFLVLCFTAYGSLLAKLFDPSITKLSSILVFNVAEYALALLGLIFSFLWVKMGKGSKAWYEVYESAIRALETDHNYTNKKAAKIGGFTYATLPEYSGVDINNNLFSNKAGEFSVSKLNIAIGQVFMVLWSVLALVHVIVLGVKLHDQPMFAYSDLVSVSLGLILFVAVLCIFGGNKTFKSSSMQWFMNNNKNQKNGE